MIKTIGNFNNDFAVNIENVIDILRDRLESLKKYLIINKKKLKIYFDDYEYLSIVKIIVIMDNLI